MEVWPAQARTNVSATAQAPRTRRAMSDRALFLWKTALLLVTTIALIPILAWQHEYAATAYVAFLVIVHVLGLGIFAWGVRKHHIAPSRRGLVVRIVGLVVLTGLLLLASKGLSKDLTSAIFWISLTAIWLLHTVGVAMLHLRRRPAEQAPPAGLCPFA